MVYNMTLDPNNILNIGVISEIINLLNSLNYPIIKFTKCNIKYKVNIDAVKYAQQYKFSYTMDYDITTCLDYKRYKKIYKLLYKV